MAKAVEGERDSGEIRKTPSQATRAIIIQWPASRHSADAPEENCRTGGGRASRDEMREDLVEGVRFNYESGSRFDVDRSHRLKFQTLPPEASGLRVSHPVASAFRTTSPDVEGEKAGCR